MNRYLSRTLYIGLALLVHYSTLSQPMHPMPISLVPMQVLDSGFTSWQWLNPLPQGNDLYDVCIVDSNTVVAVGGNGTIIRSVNSGVTWEVNHRTGGSYTILTSVHFSSEKTGIILGGRADIDRWGSVILGTTNGGATWIEQPASYHGNLSDAWSIDDQTKIVIGDSGTILRSSNGGGTWSLRQSGTLSALAAVAFANESLGFAVGDSGTILRTTDSGLSWDRLASGTTGFLKRLQVLDTALVFAVGNAGTLLRTTNGGDSWQLIWPWYAADLIGFSYETEE